MTEHHVPYLDGVLAQPANLARSREVVLAGLEKPLPARFAQPDSTILMTGMGASLFACIPAVTALRASGRRAWALSTTDVLDEPRPEMLGDAVVAVSQSGRSAETSAALDRLVRVPSVAVCNAPDSPVGRAADAVVELGSQPDTPVSTLTYTATLQALGLLAARVSGSSAEVTGPVESTCTAVLDAATAPARRAAGRWSGVSSVDVVGRGPGMASAAEAALLLREAVHLPATATDTLQYLHGPLEVAEPGRAALVFGSGRELRLARDLAEYGCEVVLVTTADVPEADRLTVFRLPQAGVWSLPIVEILPVQLMVWHLAQARGLGVTGFRHHQDDTKLTA